MGTFGNTFAATASASAADQQGLGAAASPEHTIV